MPDVFILILWIILSLGLLCWIAEGGRFGRWIALSFFLILLSLASLLLVRSPLFYRYSKGIEQAYMLKIAQAGDGQRIQFSVNDVFPFEWTAICFVDAPYQSPHLEEREEILKMTGVDFVGWRTREDQPLFVFATNKGGLLVRDDSEFIAPVMFKWPERAFGQLCFRKSERGVMVVNP